MSTITWQQQVEQEIQALIEASALETNEMWRTGEIPAGSSIGRLAPEFVGRQYASWYEGGLYEAAGADWVRGTEQAALRYKGKGITWRIDQLCVLPRTPDEAAVMYRVNHFDGGEMPAARALFLETWVKRDGQWYQARHNAEKAACK